MNLYQNRFIHFNLDAAHGIIEMAWQPDAPLMTEEEVKQAFLTYTELVEIYRPTAMLTYNEGEPYVIMPDLQEWLDQNVTPRLLRAGIRFAGVVVQGNHLVAKVAAEILVQEPNARFINTRFFDDVPSARKWLIHRTNSLLQA